jgi:hypothetical protein
MRKVKLINNDPFVVRWGGNDSPTECGLVLGEIYTVEKEEVHSWHTKFFLVECPGKRFNSAHFDDVETH